MKAPVSNVPPLLLLLAAAVFVGIRVAIFGTPADYTHRSLEPQGLEITAWATRRVFMDACDV